MLAALQLMHSECGRICWVAFGEGGLIRGDYFNYTGVNMFN